MNELNHPYTMTKNDQSYILPRKIQTEPCELMDPRKQSMRNMQFVNDISQSHTGNTREV